MDDLTPAETDELCAALATLRDELRAQLTASAAGAQPVALDEPIGRVSRMDAMQQQSMVQANRRAMQQRLHQAEAALRRCSEQEYGDCLECGEAVGYRRLKVQPETPFCIACQSRSELRS